MYFCIRYSDNSQSVFFKESRSFFVVLFSFLGIMSRAVKLYNELCLCTVKICNILTENLLTRKADRIGAQKIIPKMFFFFCHILSQHFCGWNNFFVVFSLHYNPFVTLRVPPPFTQGRLLANSTSLDKLEFVCVLQCFHKQVFLISAWNVGKSADYLISMLFIKFGGLPTHCIKMNMVTASADGFFFSFT